MLATVVPEVIVEVYVRSVTEVFESASVEILISRGSISHVPERPIVDVGDVLTRISSTFSRGADVSIRPPSPKRRPPRAVMCPRASTTAVGLLGSAQNTTVPPLPSSRALTSIRAPLAISMLRAGRRSPAPCHSPPTKMLPPPTSPFAKTRLVDSNRTSSASTTSEPARVPERSTVPPMTNRSASRTSSTPGATRYAEGANRISAARMRRLLAFLTSSANVRADTNV